MHKQIKQLLSLFLFASILRCNFDNAGDTYYSPDERELLIHFSHVIQSRSEMLRAEYFTKTASTNIRDDFRFCQNFYHALGLFLLFVSSLGRINLNIMTHGTIWYSLSRRNDIRNDLIQFAILNDTQKLVTIERNSRNRITRI